MKKMKTVLIVGAVFALTITWLSCKKEGNFQMQDPNIGTNTAKLHDDLENPDDTSDESMNDNLFMLANAFVRISNNSDLMAIVYDEAANNGGYVNYEDLIALDSRFKNLLNVKLDDLFCPNPLGTPDDPYQEIVDDMIYKTVEYFPAIYFPNYLTAETDYLPVIGIGAEIDDYDNIITYVIDGDDITESTINETEALAATAPVIIINNATDHLEYADTGSPTFSAVSTQPSSPASNEIWKWDEVLIMAGYRYEGKGKSEVRAQVTFHTNTGTFLSGGSSFQNGIEESLIKKVTGSDIANSTNQTGVNSDVFPAAGSVTTTNLNYYDQMYITTFEYDWYASPKAVTSCSAFSSNGFQHDPEMKYSNEWYHNSVCGITMHATWLNYVNGTCTFGNAKSVTKIKRTQ